MGWLCRDLVGFVSQLVLLKMAAKGGLESLTFKAPGRMNIEARSQS